MFDWQNRRQNVDPLYRAVYLVQFVLMIAAFAGLFLVWWRSTGADQNAFDLLGDSIEKLSERDPTIIGQPLILLWLLLPLMAISAMRGFTGLLVTPVSYRVFAWISWVVAMLVLAHFLINFGSELSEDSPLKDGRIGIGFWVSGGAITLLGAMLTAETLIHPPEDPLAGKPVAGGPVEDAQRLWEGDYQTCPHCGMLNEPKARKCYNCNNLLFKRLDPD